MFGWKPHLPIDIHFGTNTADLKGNTSTKYVENLNMENRMRHTRPPIKLLKRNRSRIIGIMIAGSDAHN